ncbi:MAG: imidazole glycerol phosphate synthase subunit HisH [Bacteroidota bacterium]|nr:imidazole glycerol phosphate synthase subunit HisH [Bacteroidota bacterium]
MKVAIIKYNAGNVQSVTFALQRLGIEPVLTDNPEILSNADKIIFPGVGEASTAMEYLKERKLDILIPQLKQPVLGICLGMQLMCSYSEENNTPCLDIFNLKVKRFPENKSCKVPQMGWNNIYDLKGQLYTGIDNNSYVYFVHSYYAELSEYTIAKTDYILPFSSSLNKDNFYATQFHPEKSSKTGNCILKNFLNL